jgi:hypothetical protein
VVTTSFSMGRMAAGPPGTLKDGICKPMRMITLLLNFVHF